MSRFRRAVPVVLLLVVIPASASAQGLFRWLGRLSGPGPFVGASAEFRLKCLGVGKDDKEEGEKKEGQVETMGAIGIRVSCNTSLDDRHTTIYLNVSGAFALDNSLFYGDVGGQGESTAVRLLTTGISADWTVFRPLDVGAGLGVMYFAGPRFANFSRGFIQPIRLTGRPLLLLLPGSKDEDGWLLVWANWQILLGKIEGSDFGAPLDPLRERNEHIHAIGASIDLIRFMKRFKIGQR